MPRWSKVAGVWIGMVAVWVLIYGLAVNLPVQREYVPASAGGFIALGITGLLAWMGVHLTRQIPSDRAAAKSE